MDTIYRPISISAFTYQVNYDPTLADEGGLGRILFLRDRIELNPNLSKDMEWVTLIHECLHGFLFHAGQKDHDEATLDILSRGLLQLVKNNPELFQ